MTWRALSISPYKSYDVASTIHQSLHGGKADGLRGHGRVVQGPHAPAHRALHGWACHVLIVASQDAGGVQHGPSAIRKLSDHAAVVLIILCVS